MNENVLSFIKWAAGIVITLAIISIAFFVFSMAKDGTMESTKKIGDMNAQIAESDITIYDQQEVLGSEVVNAIRKFEEDYIGIRVVTGKDTAGTWYGYSGSVSSGVVTLSAAASSDLADAIDETDGQYINPNGKFVADVLRDANGAAVAIAFEQK